MHQDLAKYLSCYSKSTQGGQYQRRCESRRHGKAQANTIMNQHGLVWNQIQTYGCDFDGSFAQVTIHFSRLINPDTAEGLKIFNFGGGGVFGLNRFLLLKVSKSRKQIMVSSILPKNELGIIFST